MQQTPNFDASFLADLAAIRRDIHAHPELAFNETRTADIVAAELARYGVEVHRGLAKTGVVGVIRSGGRPGDLLRSDGRRRTQGTSRLSWAFGLTSRPRPRPLARR